MGKGKAARTDAGLPSWWGDIMGAWEGEGITLILALGGNASWERTGRFSTASISGRLRFKEPDFLVITFLFFRKKLRVTRVPWLEGGRWQAEIDGRRLSRKADPSEAVPAADGLERLVRDCFRTFNEALLVNDFRGFHAGVAKLWQSQMGPEGLAAAFSGLTERRIVLGEFIAAPVAFNREPSIEPISGFLRLDGYFASSPLLRFNLAFTYEHPEWKLVSINLNLG